MPPSQETITLDQTDPVFESDVTFTVTDANLDEHPTIQLQCFQDGQLVFATAHAAYPGGYGYGDPFKLGPSYAWSGGAAEGHAVLGHRNSHNGKFVVDAETSFAIGA